MIAPVVFDELGRKQYKFLEYSASSTNGGFQYNAFTDQSSFYNSYYSQNPAVYGEHFFYGRTEFESSPLNRPLKEFAPGNSWVGSQGGADEHNSQFQYDINTNDQIQIWNIQNNALTYVNDDLINIPSTNSTYASGALVKNISVDENKHSTLEFTDKDGHLILKKVQINDNPNYGGYDDWLCTYYVYDDYGFLRFVIPPKAVDLIKNNWLLSADIVSELCFRYEYDAFGRMIAKKEPGMDWNYTVYDKRDRSVFTQNGNMKATGEWLYTLYDELNRPQETGMMKGYQGTRDELQTIVDGLVNTTNPTTISTGSSTGVTSPNIPSTLIVSEIDPGRTSYVATSEIELGDDLFLDPGITVEGHILFEVCPICNDGSNSFNTTKSVNMNPFSSPYLNGYTPIPLTFNFYDNYAWTNKSYINNNQNLTKGSNVWNDPLPTQQVNQIYGMVTGNRVRIIDDPLNLDQGKWLENATFYDNENRPIQNQKTNSKGGQDIITSLYNFSGQVICTNSINYNEAGNVKDLTIKTNLNFDHSGRLLNITKQINNNPTIQISEMAYDAIGKLISKDFGQQRTSDLFTDNFTNGGTPINGTTIQHNDYNYNIRGWLKSINWSTGIIPGISPNIDMDQNKWFAMDLSYDWGYVHNQFGGDIAGQKWTSAGDDEQRSFGYGYDGENKFLFADFKQFNTGVWDNHLTPGSGNIDFSILMGSGLNDGSAYDRNGGILAMKQYGLNLNSSNLIDDLKYIYYPNSNKLQSVVDFNNDPSTLLGDFRTKVFYSENAAKQQYITNPTNVNVNSFTDYAYDNSGNLVKDLNKDIFSNRIGIKGPGISYNYMNLPTSMTVNNSGSIEFTYDALGNKLQEKINVNGIRKTLDYVGDFLYKDNTLEFFNQEEGRIRRIYNSQFKTYDYCFDYFIKDHLRNTRVVLTDQKQKDFLPVVTYESNTQPNESLYYNNVTNGISPRPTSFSFTDANGNNNGSSVQMLRAIEFHIGASRLLKVMAGDKVNAQVYYYYINNSQFSNGYANGKNTLQDGLQTILNSSNLVPSAAKSASQTIANNVSNLGSFLQFIYPQDDQSYSITPRAYLNILFFDNHFNFIAQSSKFLQITTANVPSTMILNDIEAPKNGYAFIYINNESNEPVYFDNFQVSQEHGPLLQDNVYSPWGMQLQGISDNALNFGNALSQKYKFQNQQFIDDLGVNFYEFKYRQNDPQLGRFLQVDPLSDKYQYNSPYAFSENHITNAVELEGLEKHDLADGTTVYGPYSSDLLYDFNGYIDADHPSPVPNPSFSAFASSYKSPVVTQAETSELLEDWQNTTFYVSNLKASGLQGIQIAELTAQEPSNTTDDKGFYVNTYRFSENNQNFQGFVDGGSNSPYQTISHKLDKFPGLPYDPIGQSYFYPSVGEGLINLSDMPSAQRYSDILRFSTYIVATNYLGTNKDRILGRYNWGWTDYGRTQTFKNGLAPFQSGSYINSTNSGTLFHDYPNYSLFGWRNGNILSW